MINSKFSKKLFIYLSLPLPILSILLFSYYIILIIRRFDQIRNSGCIANIISANKKEDINTVLIDPQDLEEDLILDNK